MVQQLHVLLRPVVTEKSTFLQEQNKYVFAVSLNANKVMIRKAVPSSTSWSGTWPAATWPMTFKATGFFNAACRTLFHWTA